MKKTLALGIIMFLLLGLFIAGCNEGGVAGGPAIEMISAEVQTGEGEGEETTAEDTDSQLIPETTETAAATETGATGMTTTETMAGEGQMNVVVEVSVANFEMVSEIGETDGDGYLAFYMDELPAGISRVPGIEVSPTPEGAMDQPTNETIDTSYTFENVEPGVHIFSVQLVDASGNPLSPPVIAAAVLTVPQPASETETATETTGETTAESTATETTDTLSP